MPCRVGMTTDPEERKAYWKSKVEGFKNWQILKTFTNKEKEQAQKYETDYATKHGCEAAPGGPDAPGAWYVYRFDYTKTR